MYRSSIGIVFLVRLPPEFFTVITVVWEGFQACRVTLLSIPNSSATLATLGPLSDHPLACKVVSSGHIARSKLI